MPRVLGYIVVVSVLTYTTHAQQVSSAIQTNSQMKKQQNDGSSKIKIYEELFKKSFSHQRKEHAEAIKRLQKIDSYERLYKMIMILGDKMIDAIETSKTLIENTDFNPDDKSLPQNVTVQSAISTTLENTAFFGDIVLHFPYIIHRIWKPQKKWYPIINWSFNFTNQTKYLLDTETLATVHLAAQELNIIERERGYLNPYWQPTESRGDGEEKKKKNSTKRKQQKRGPQMTRIEF